MTKSDGVVTDLIRIQVSEHAKTHLLVATSDNLPGLVLAARSIEQLEEEFPGAIREVLEAMGKVVISVSDETAENFSQGFLKRSYIASAKLAA